MVREIQCKDNDMRQFVRQLLSSECGKRVGELGFGTNFAVRSAIPMNSHVNERCPGVHLGLGQHNQERDVVDYQCNIHLDLIARGGTVWVGDDWAVDLSRTPPSSGPHPRFTTDEDVFSPEATDDCCGVAQCDSAARISSGA